MIGRALAVFSLAIAAPILICGSAEAQEPLQVRVPTVDYPPGISPNGSDRRVRLRYALDRTGHVTACAVAGRSGEPALDAESCRILTTRARIRPEAGRVDGQLVFVWLGQDSGDIPARRGEPLAYDLVSLHRISNLDYPAEASGRSGTVSYAVTVSPAGLPIRCTIVQSSGVPALDQRTCEIVMTRAIYIPSADERASGGSVAHGRIRWERPPS